MWHSSPLDGQPPSFALLTCLMEFAISLSKNAPLPTLELVLGREIANGTMQTNRIVMLDISLNYPLPFLGRW